MKQPSSGTRTWEHGTHTQKQLKELVGADLHDYRRARGINEKPEERRRCWRLRYADNLSFHMDVVPSIPESVEHRESMRSAMVMAGTSYELANNVAALTGAITDNELPNYDVVSPKWRISNSEGYALWFESRIKLAPGFLDRRALEAGVAGVAALPIHRWKSPLQIVVQLLKRHRDVMFAASPDGAPISIIITTLAGKAYAGEGDVGSALWRILSTMEHYINPNTPHVPNPVNPAEDFADKWVDPKCRRLDLAGNFVRWLAQVRNDFQTFGQIRDVDQALELTRTKFAATLDANTTRLKIAPHLPKDLLSPAITPTGLSFPPKPVVPSKPGGFA
jgi:hypothetical protein